MKPTQKELIETAVGWARQFPELGVPDDISAADCVLTTHMVRHSAKEGGSGTLNWQGMEITIIIHGLWAVDLGEIGAPKGPPRVLRARR